MLTIMNDRLLQFLSAENISQAQFADSINVARAGVSHIVAGRNKPGWDFIINTMNRYPTLNIEWLLTGKGKMYKSSAANNVSGAKKELNSLFDEVNSSEEGGSEGEIFESETVELGVPASQAAQQVSQLVAQPVNQYSPHPAAQQVSQPVPQYAPQSASQPAALPYSAPQSAVKKPNVAKIIVFFDDGTFQECK